MIDQDFINQYTLLLIKQYWEKPKAKAEIELLMSTWSESYSLFSSFEDAFDLDLAIGNQLDIIGRIVGVPRNVPLVLEKIRFGFDGDATARGFAELFNSDIESAPMFDLFETVYTDQQLDDYDYRFFIKAKIARNISSGIMTSDERISLQDSIQASFNGQAYVLDNYDMSLILTISPSVDEERIRTILSLDLLPKPQAVRYSLVIAADSSSFGFLDDPNALGFGDAFDSSVGGTLASLII